MKKIGLFLMLGVVLSVNAQDSKFYQIDTTKKSSMDNLYYQPSRVDTITSSRYLIPVNVVPMYNIYQNGNVRNQPIVPYFYHH
jgi:hypothetical protein